MFFEPLLIKERQRHGLFAKVNGTADPSQVYKHAVELREHYINEHAKFGSKNGAFLEHNAQKNKLL